MKNLPQYLPGYEEPTNLFDLIVRSVEGENDIVA